MPHDSQYDMQVTATVPLSVYRNDAHGRRCVASSNGAASVGGFASTGGGAVPRSTYDLRRHTL